MSLSRQHPVTAGPLLTRRRLLACGGMAPFAWRLGSLLNQAASAAEKSPHASPIRSCILLFYYGGPSHLDLWDMKPDAPQEVRGIYQPIATSVPGIQMGELLPMTARWMDRMAIVRSVHHPMTNHNAAVVEALCGRTPVKGDLELLANDPLVDFPCFGAALHSLVPAESSVPMHVALPHVMYNVVVLPAQNAGFLGAAHNPLQITSDPNRPDFKVDELTLPGEISSNRLLGRHDLLSQLASTEIPKQKRPDPRQTMATYQERAIDMLESEPIRKAFRINDESDQTRDRYGRNTLGQSLLLSRRLVESGVKFINVNDKIHNGQLANWDSHTDVFPRMTNDLVPPADQAYSALLEDLDQRGLLDSTLVVATGEFGRTPRINGSGGRDHWPNCYSVVFAGGGIKGGMTWGTSDKIGAYPDKDPVTTGDLAATIFSRFGLDPHQLIYDGLGRPHHLAAGEPLTPLFS